MANRAKHTPEEVLRPVFTPVVIRVEISKAGAIATYPSDIEDFLQPASSTHTTAARIFVIEADKKSLDSKLEPWIRQAAWPRRNFLKAHFEGSDCLRRALESEADVFFADWWQIAVQTDPGPRQSATAPTSPSTNSTSASPHQIQQWISSGKPYDIHTVNDPLRLRLDHERYYPWPDCPHRPYFPISTSVDEEGEKTSYFSAQQRMSYYFTNEGGFLSGIVLVDPVRHLDVVRYTFGTWILRERKHEQFQVPCFVQSAQQGSVIGNDRVNGRVRRKSATTGFGEERVLNRLIGALQRANNGGTAMQSPDKAVVMAMAEIVCDDFSDVVDRIGCAIDDIDLTIHNDRILQESVSRWREQLGRWQNILIHQRRFLGHTSRSLAGRANTDLELEGHGLESRLATLETEIDWTARRAQTTFQSLMSSIAIVESARAIREAESVAKLTQLAFFFVPLALVASVFGMNIVEFESQLAWWHWLAVSIGTSAVTYFALYRAEIASVLSQLLDDTMGLSIPSLRRFVSRWLRILQFLAYQLDDLLFGLILCAIPLGYFAGLSVATWKIAASNLAVGSKAAIGVGVWILGLVLFILVAGSLYLYIALYGLLFSLC